MTSKKAFRCVLIGETTLPEACAERLLASGHTIVGVVSRDERLQQWAAARQIPFTASPAELLALLGGQPFDHLFSIVNPAILPSALLAAPVGFAINYHDAPLPRYAGTHASSWALIHGETRHAISWHLMHEKVDAGDLMQQAWFDLAPDETALSINAKCYDAALSAFETLIHELAEDKVTPQPQDLRARTFFANERRPEAGACLRFDRPAEQASALVRALDFGPYRNPLGTAKIATLDGFVTVGSVDVLDTVSDQSPGTVIATSDTSLVVATATRDLRLAAFSTLAGASVSATALGYSPAQRLPSLPQQEAELLTQLHAQSVRHEAFWVAQLQAAEPLRLPYARQAAETAGDVRQYDLDLPAGWCSDDILAAYAVYLARITQLSSFDLGHISPRHAEQRIAAFFAAAVPLRCDIDLQHGFAAARQRMAEQLATLQKRGVPTRDIVQRYPELRTTGEPRWPLLVEIVDSDHWHDGAARLSELGGTLLLQIAADGSACRWIYDASALDEAYLPVMAAQWQVLLRELATETTQPLASLPLLDEAARQRQLVEWNDTAVAYPQDQVIHQLFEQHAAQAPDQIALVFEDRQLSYGDLDTRANQLAHYLRSQGVGPDVLVGVSIERSFDMIVALLAILKAGGAYLPLDPDYPAERIAYMLADAQPRLVLTQAHRRDVLAGHGIALFCVDEAAEQLASHAITRPASHALPQHLAYVIYTSGSTGRPKGTLLSHVGLCNLITAQIATFDIRPGQRVLQFASLNFDASTWEIFLALGAGATLCLASKADLVPGETLQATLQRQAIEMAVLPPVALPLLSAPALTGLRTLVVGGDACTAALVREWAPGRRFCNAYGPTEITVCTTVQHCDVAHNASPIGRPIANSRVYLLDENLEPVPVGVAGELYIAGAGLARGYLGRPDLTAERFVPNPFSQDGERMYRSGDLARYLPDGRIEYLGRIDQQVKLRGFRIELGEIEACLTALPIVRDAVVLAREDEPGDKRLVAYLVADANQTLEPASLREALQQRLPDYMVPARFIVLDQLPLTPNGKVDRKALPAPDRTRDNTSYIAPRNDTEAQLAAIWADVFKLDRVGVHDNFFELGGHSLLAVSLVERMRQAGHASDVGTLFSAPSVSALAAKIHAGTTQADVPPNLIPAGCTAITPDMLPLITLTPNAIATVVAAVPGGAPNIQDIYPLGALQEGILFHHQLDGDQDGDTYLIKQQFVFDSRARLDRFTDALQTVIDRHDNFRTAVLWQHLEQAVQVVLRQATLEVEKIQLDAAAGAAARQLDERYDARHYRLPVDRAPMLHAVIAEDGTSGRWVLHLLLHHLICDHTTLEYMAIEVQAILAGQADQLPAAPPFRNFIAQTRLGVDAAAHRAFFTAMLGHIHEPTAPYGVVDVYSGGTDIDEVHHVLPIALAKRIRRHTRAHQVSAASLLHLAWGLVLARLTGRDDAVFGTVLFGRLHGGAGADRIMGQCINTLPVCVAIGTASVADGLRNTHALLIELLQHEHASLAEAQRCSGMAASTPPFSSLVNYRYSQSADSVFAASRWEGMAVLHFDERTNYPLTLTVDDLGEGFGLMVQGSAAVKPHEVCAYLSTAIASLLDALDNTPDAPLAHTEVLPAAERQQLLATWNATTAPVPQAQTIHCLFELQAAQTPDRIAVIFEQDQLTYGELDRRANQLAHYLQAQGVGPDVLVGLCMDRSLGMIVALLGILKAGGAYIPLDPTYPQDRLAYMLADAKPKLLLTQPHLLDVAEHDVPTFCPDSTADALATYPQTTVDGGARPEHLAYVIYTSGSTGRPKGVMVEHGTVANFLGSMAKAPGLDANDVMLALTTLSFDIAGLELYLPLTVGARIVLSTRHHNTDAELLARTIAEHDVTAMQATPSGWRLLLDSGWAGKPDLKALCGGEALPADLAVRLLARTGSLWNLYGPTETTIWSTQSRITSAGEASAVSIGRPIDNTQIYILDVHGLPTPQGIAGELYIGGAGVARGYLNRPDLTDERFVPDPFSPQPGARMYRTGDLVRYLPDGNIDYLGRIDHQVKIRGYRIELGEIEAALAVIPAVREAVVVAREDGGDKRLVAYLVPHAGQSPDATALREQLRHGLPDFMVPAQFVVLDQLPLTPNGKVDRKALPAPDRNTSSQQGYIAPRNATETLLAAIWAEVLKLDRIGVNDDFFILGGHSLLATQVMSKLRNRMQVDLPLRRLFDLPTIAALARQIDATGRQQQNPVIAATSRDAALPLSFAQQRLWFLDQLAPGNALYSIFTGLRLIGSLHEDALRQAFAAIVERHEALRTRFVQHGNGPVQVIDAVGTIDWSKTDLSALPPAERENTARQLAQGITQQPFNLAHGPLVRLGLIRLSEHEHLLITTLHHIVADGWSLGLLTQALAHAYGALVRGQQPALSPLPIQYADFAAWQRQHLAGDALRPQLDYWAERLAGAPEQLTLPTDRPRPLVQRHRGACHAFSVDDQLLAQLRTLGQHLHSTLFMTLAAAFSVLLSRYAGQQDICLGTPVANRHRGETEGLIGFFVNTLVLRTHCDGDFSFEALLGQVRDNTLAAYEHQDAPFEQVVERINPARHTSHAPLFQAMLVLQNNPAYDLTLPGLTLAPYAIDSHIARFDLTLNVVEDGDTLQALFEYDTDLFDAATIARMAGHFTTLLGQIVAAPERRVADLALLSAEESRQLLVDWNDTVVAYPAEQAIHQLFEQHAAKTPDQIALVFEGQQLSYGELDARANQLAHYLRSQGIGPDVLVGLCLDRSLDLVIGLLAVLKAGGAYLPLDPDYPAERLAYMLADAKPQLVLTQSAHRHVLAGQSVDLCCLDELAALFDAYSTQRPVLSVLPQQLAYVIYTSGSTGRPKGTLLSHAGLTNLALAQIAAFGVQPNQRVLQFASFNFDAATSEIFMALGAGATLCLASKANLTPGQALQTTLQQLEIQVATLPPVALPWLDASTLPALTTLIVAGEACPVALVDSWAPGRRFFNAYGPTETTVCATIQRCDNGNSTTPPIGRPIANTRVYLLDDALQPVPVGVAGELYVAGIGLARGYFGRPDLTAERFVPNPYGEAGERMYRSGDLARYLPDGRIEYLGRIDQQVKLRGFRIELGEIEASLTALPAVRDAVVLAREDEPGDKRLVAYLVTDAVGKAIDVSTLREALLQRLPDYMIPAHFIVLDQLPLTPNGKVDRKALPAPDRNRDETSYVAPRNTTEAQLAALWAEVLKLDRVGIHDNFFELGGHSLLAVSLLERMRQAGLASDVGTLFSAPSVAALAAKIHIGTALAEIPPNLIPTNCTAITPAMLPLIDLTPEAIATIVAAVPGGAANIQDIYPLAPLQEGMLFHHLLEKDGDAYLLKVQFGFDHRARLDRFLAALQTVIDRHDTFRTALCWQQLDQPVQVVLRQAVLPVETVQLNAADGAIAAQLDAHYDPKHYRLDIRRAPMMQALIAEDTTSGHWVLHLLQHHLISDHTTLDLLFTEIQTILSGQGDQLPEPVPFRNFVAQTNRVDEAAHEAFFTAMLGQIEEPTAPYGITDVHSDGAATEEVRLELPNTLSQRLYQATRTAQVSVASLMHLAWGLVLARLTGQENVVFGTVLFGRLQGGDSIERVMGLCINTLPFRVDVGTSGVNDSLRGTHEQLAQLMRHEHASLVQAQRCSGVAGSAPLFSSLLNYRYSQRTESIFAGPAWEGLEVLHFDERTNYPLTVAIDDLGDGFSFTVRGSADAKPASVVGYLRTAIERVLDQLENAPQAPLARLDILPPAERQQLLTDWNATAADYPTDQTLQRLFEAQAASTPDNVAVVCQGDQLTYDELNRRANQVAHYLQAHGVGPDVLVGLCVERSLDMLVGVLGILKAGGAYLPLDPSYPQERLAYLLADAKPAVLLTQRHLLGTLPTSPVETICIDEPTGLDAYPRSNPTPRASAHHLAYVIYTSGSTGQPKGVEVEQRSVINLWTALEQRALHALGRPVSVALNASLAFDASVQGWLQLLSGHRLVIVPADIRADGAAMWRFLTAHRIDLFDCTPVQLDGLMQAGLAGADAYQPRMVLVGGDAISPALWQRLANAPRTVFYNVYGPTECTVDSTAARLSAANPQPNIGQPLANTQVYILDTHGLPVPQGVAGELYIGGEGVARGYLNRPALTAERFIADRFNAKPGARLYRTGDLARWSANGALEYLGRNDHQLKLRGFRIEPGEIEAALLALPAVREAIVLAREDDAGEKQLVAYLMAHVDTSLPETAALRSQLQRSLPDHMIPAYFIALDALPLTPNHKVDRKALPAPTRSDPTHHVAPRNDVETQLADIWAEVLKLERVGIHDNFFELGGHSLSATQVVIKIRERFCVDIPLRALFEDADIARLGRRIDDLRSLLNWNTDDTPPSDAYQQEEI
ncbi:non-ribosomal peptide synthetase [Andreprevotia chitinilytica]|uniref:non-ribosomal peptide synthetase n=1 Tax=Andreprevotia chitinilytica TaxID=396808 RepID=UPI00068F9DC1|nr:non-ribosomal peptide synthetase [Andreprevotia chitinilytica]